MTWSVSPRAQLKTLPHKARCGQAWWHTPLIAAVHRQRQVDTSEFEAILIVVHTYSPSYREAGQGTWWCTSIVVHTYSSSYGEAGQGDYVSPNFESSLSNIAKPSFKKWNGGGQGKMVQLVKSFPSKRENLSSGSPEPTHETGHL